MPHKITQSAQRQKVAKREITIEKAMDSVGSVVSKDIPGKRVLYFSNAWARATGKTEPWQL